MTTVNQPPSVQTNYPTGPVDRPATTPDSPVTETPPTADTPTTELDITDSVASSALTAPEVEDSISRQIELTEPSSEYLAANSTLDGLLDGNISAEDIAGFERLLTQLETLAPAERGALLERLASGLETINQSEGNSEDFRELVKSFESSNEEVNTRVQRLSSQVRQSEGQLHTSRVSEIIDHHQQLQRQAANELFGSARPAPLETYQEGFEGLIEDTESALSDIEHDLAEIDSRLSQRSSPEAQQRLREQREVLVAQRTRLSAIVQDLQLSNSEVLTLIHERNLHQLTEQLQHPEPAPEGSSELEQLQTQQTQLTQLGEQVQAEIAAVQETIQTMQGDPPGEDPFVVERVERLQQSLASLEQLQVNLGIQGESLTQDVAHEQLRERGVELHERVTELTETRNGRRGALRRINQIPRLQREYETLGNDILSQIQEIDETLMPQLEERIASSEGVTREQLVTQREELQAQRRNLVVLYADFSRAQSLDADSLLDPSNFGGLRSSINRRSRGALLNDAMRSTDAAQEMLRESLQHLRENGGSAEDIELLESKLDGVESASDQLGVTSADFTRRLAEADMSAGQRAQVLNAMQMELLDRMNGDPDFDTLLTVAMGRPGPERTHAREALEQMTQDMADIIARHREPYARGGPGQDALDILDLFQEKLREYDFTRISTLEREGGSLNDQVVDINRDIERLFEEINNMGGMRRSEVEQLRDTDGAINDIGEADLTRAHQLGYASSYLERSIVEVGQLSRQMGPRAEYLLEHPDHQQSEEMLEDMQAQAVSSIERWQRSFEAWYLRAEGEDENSSEVQALNALLEKAQTIELGDDVDMSELDERIEQSIAGTSQPYRGQLQRLYEHLSSMEETMEINTRIERVTGTENDLEGALALAHTRAEENPELAYGIVDLGWQNGPQRDGWMDRMWSGQFQPGQHRGYAIVAYPASEYDRKLGEANQQGSGVMYVVGTNAEGDIREGGRQHIQSAREYQSLESIDSPDALDYAHALEDRERYQDDNELFNALMTAGSNYDYQDLARYLEDNFGVSPRVNMEGSLFIADRVRHYSGLYDRAVERGDSEEASRIRSRVMRSDFFEVVQNHVDEGDGASHLQRAMVRDMGQRAQELALENYDQAIENYTAYSSEDSDELAVALFAVAARGGEQTEQYLENMFGLTSGVARAGAESSEVVSSNIMATYRRYQEARSSGDETEAQRILDRFKGSEAFQIAQAGAEERLDQLQTRRREIADLSDYQAAFELTQEFPHIRTEIYQQYGLNIDPNLGVPPYQDGDEVEGLSFSNPVEEAFIRQSETWGDYNTAVSVTTTGAIIVGSIALGIATGGSSLAVQMGVAVGTAAAMGAADIYRSHEALEDAEADISASMIGAGQLRQARDNLAMSYVSAIINVGVAGATFGIGSQLAPPQSLLRAVGQDIAIGTVGTLLDPQTYRGGVEGMLVNIAINGFVSFGSTGAAFAARSGVPPGALGDSAELHIMIDRNEGRIYGQVADGDPVELRPLSVNDDGTMNLQFQGPDGTLHTLERVQVRDTYAQLVPEAQVHDAPPLPPGAQDAVQARLTEASAPLPSSGPSQETIIRGRLDPDGQATFDRVRGDVRGENIETAYVRDGQLSIRSQTHLDAPHSANQLNAVAEQRYHSVLDEFRAQGLTVTENNSGNNFSATITNSAGEEVAVVSFRRGSRRNAQITIDDRVRGFTEVLNLSADAPPPGTIQYMDESVTSWSRQGNIDAGVPSPADLLALKGSSSQVGNFEGLAGASIEDIVARIPSHAQLREMSATGPGANIESGFEYRWTDNSGQEWRVRMHGPDRNPTIPDDSNSSQGWTLRVVREDPATGITYEMGPNGQWHNQNTLNTDSPTYNAAAANDVHIPILDNPNVSQYRASGETSTPPPPPPPPGSRGTSSPAVAGSPESILRAPTPGDPMPPAIEVLQPIAHTGGDNPSAASLNETLPYQVSADGTQPRTFIERTTNINGEDVTGQWLVTGYDPNTGMAQLSHSEVTMTRMVTEPAPTVQRARTHHDNHPVVETPMAGVPEQRMTAVGSDSLPEGAAVGQTFTDEAGTWRIEQLNGDQAVLSQQVMDVDASTIPNQAELNTGDTYTDPDGFDWVVTRGPEGSEQIRLTGPGNPDNSPGTIAHMNPANMEAGLPVMDRRGQLWIVEQSNSGTSDISGQPRISLRRYELSVEGFPDFTTSMLRDGTGRSIVAENGTRWNIDAIPGTGSSRELQLSRMETTRYVDGFGDLEPHTLTQNQMITDEDGVMWRVDNIGSPPDYDIQVSRLDGFDEVDLNQLTRGQIIVDDENVHWRVDFDEGVPGDHRVTLSRVVTQEVPANQLLAGIEAGTITTSTPETVDLRAHGVLERIQQAWRMRGYSASDPSLTVERVGRSNISFNDTPETQAVSFPQSQRTGSQIEGFDSSVDFNALTIGQGVTDSSGTTFTVVGTDHRSVFIETPGAAHHNFPHDPDYSVGHYYVDEGSGQGFLVVRNDPTTGMEVAPVLRRDRVAPERESHVYNVEVTLPHGRGTREIEVVVPVRDDGSQDTAMRDQLIEAISQMPTSRIESIERIRLNPDINVDDPLWRADPNYGPNHESAATAGAGTIDFYPMTARYAELHGETFARDQFVHHILHEQGHNIATLYFGQPGIANVDERWIAAMAMDQNYTSHYSTTNPNEDFAETVFAYIRSDGQGDARALYPERFRILDEVFERNPQARAELQQYYRETIIGGLAAVGTGVVALGTGAYILLSGDEEDASQ